jgi:glucosamine--fructose-6-phosphate aminotransferase (isomerizing)
LRKEWEAKGESIPKDITTDTKIIPLQMEPIPAQGHDVAEAFRLAVNDFEGSHAIAMHTDLAPGKFFWPSAAAARRFSWGSGPDHYMPTSEVYGFIEETSRFVKMDGEKVVEAAKGPTQGQIFVLDQERRRTAGITAMYYDGTPIVLTDADVKRHGNHLPRHRSPGFSPLLFKGDLRSPLSVERTLLNRWKIADSGDGRTM